MKNGAFKVSNKVKVIIIILLLSNVVLFFLYKNASDESEFRLKLLYHNFELGLLASDVGLINAQNGQGKEHLLQSYRALYRSSASADYFISRVNRFVSPSEVTDVLYFYVDILEEWINTDYKPTDEEYENMIKDLLSIQYMLTSQGETRHKKQTMLDWSENDFHRNIKALKDSLIMYVEPEREG
mgnify:CR=1 FL=1